MFFVAFIISFLSDYILRYLTEKQLLNSYLDLYFENTTSFESAFAAGIIIVIALFITSIVSQLFFHFFTPSTKNQLIQYCIIGFFIGYLADVFIKEMNIYPDLKPYYDEYHAGFVGAITFESVIIISYLIVKENKWILF